MNPTLLALSLLAAPAAPSPPALPAPPVALTTLDSALHVLRPAPSCIVLAVGADKYAVPPQAVPASGVGPGEVADAFGLLTYSFQDVLAVAPRTMTVVYAPPATPNPYDGMPPGQVLKMLARTFAPAQWKAFMSDTGVAYASMQEGAQQSLFQALFPQGHLVAQRDNPTGPNDPNAKRDLSGDDLRQAHLRIGYIVSIALPIPDKPDTHTFASSWEPPDSPPLFYMTNSQSRDVDHEFGATVRETLLSVPKPGDFPLLPRGLLVPTDGLRTVDDLLARVSRLGRCEVYADPRWGARAVTLVGEARAARADSLLHALAFCAQGTWRKVGPAFVLTDDTVGLGTKHAAWKAFEDKAAVLSGESEYTGGSPIKTAPYTTKDIPFRAGSLSFTPAQQAQYWKKQETDPYFGGGSSLQLTLPFDKLSPAQQDAAEHTQEQNQARHLNTTLDGTFLIQAEPELQIVLPALDGPVLVFESYQNLLPDPPRSPTAQAAERKRMEAFFPEMASGRSEAPAPPGALAHALAGFARRAVRLALPSTPPALAHAFSLARAVGFNEVWLQIAPGPDTPARLAQAVALGKPLGLRIFPELSLLRRADAPRSLVDLDILGHTSTEADALVPSHRADVHDTVTPFDSAVAEGLAAQVGALAATPGIGGMVWDDLVPPGYQSGKDAIRDYEHHDLGYAEAGRLAFLRAAHADPLDLYDNSYGDERAHLSVPGFDEHDFAATRALFTRWQEFRGKAPVALARRLFRALPPAFWGAGSLPVLVPPVNNDYSHWYASWDNFAGAPPTVEYISQKGPDGAPIMGSISTERLRSSLQYDIVHFYGPTPTASEAAREALAALRQAAKSGARSVVFDVAPALLETLGHAAPPAAMY